MNRFPELQTPCALVDLDVVERNASAMAGRVAALGARLRPHVKTHKTVEGARLQVRGHFGGITVSTLAEARFFARAGFRDLTLAVPIAPARMREALELSRGVGRLSLLVDGERAAAELEACAAAQELRASVFLELDCGQGRSGVDPSSPAARALAARLAASPRLDFRGVLTHAGHSYACRNRSEVLEIARRERDLAVGFAAALRADGLRVEEVSIGSTPTLSAVDHLAGVTEVRPGNYAFYDAFQAAIGTCALSDAAFTVLATVISCHPEHRRLCIDAGALALSKDQGARHVDPDAGYGVLADEDGRPLAGLQLGALTQEHGHVTAAPGVDLSRFEVGTRLRVIANHSCLTAAAHDRYVVLKEGVPAQVWQPVRGW